MRWNSRSAVIPTSWLVVLTERRLLWRGGESAFCAAPCQQASFLAKTAAPAHDIVRICAQALEDVAGLRPRDATRVVRGEPAAWGRTLAVAGGQYISNIYRYD
jgi:hypothetical protein